ncbi:hypothetical protein [Nostoc sp.]|uniref:hypothetical protein n=1 Tax=Nostoc sp. TaxID=1180 RepID=UPI002FF6FF87
MLTELYWERTALYWCKLQMKSSECMSFALTPSPSPMLGDGSKFSSSSSPTWEKGLGDDGKLYALQPINLLQKFSKM